MTSLSALFRSFFKIGLFTFGGGYAMIPLIEAEIINRRGWLARDEFMELLTLAQSSPGPIAINTSVFKGMRPAVVALIVVPTISLARGMHPALIVVAVATALAVWWFGLSPIWLIAAGAAAGILWTVKLGKEVRR